MATSPGHLLHLVAWAQIGVILRVYTELLLGKACSPSHPWIPCVTSDGMRTGGAFFVDLPVNVFGSFLMGFLVSSDVLSNSLRHTLTVEAPMAVLPIKSPLQTHLPFQVGLRTGLCGSLTTFASWMLQMVIMFVGGKPVPGGSQWVEAIAGLFVGCMCSLAALVAGQHAALSIYHKLNPGAFIPYGSPAPEQLSVEQYAEDKDLQARQQSTLQLTAGGRPVLRTSSSLRRGSATLVLVEEGVLPTALEATALQGRCTSGEAELSQAAAVSSRSDSSMWLKQQSPFAAAPSPHGNQESLNRMSSAQQQLDQHMTSSTPAADGPTSPVFSTADSLVEVITEIDDKPSRTELYSVLVVDCFALASVALLSSISIWRIAGHHTGAFYETDELPFADQYIWWAVLLGPFGCYLRFYLSRYNGALTGSWKWFPVGTYAANMLACALDYMLRAIEVRLSGLTSLQLAVLNGMVSGIGGSLSTVSTWVVEIQRLLLSFPNTSHGYSYLFISLVSALLLGLLVYGIPVWTAA